MAQFKKLTVEQITYADSGIIKFINDDGSRAYAFPALTGDLSVGDEVIVNTTAVDLSLGTGGWHFLVWNLKNNELITPSGGHIMKMRYTPFQLDSGVEEEDQSYIESDDLSPMSVIAVPLHSQIAPIVSYLKSKANLNISVLISDGAALPVALSDLLRSLKENDLINSTISFGHSFGGDFESLNIYSALITAKNIANADVAIVTMGPGIVGTNTKYGFTGIEVAHHLDVAKKFNCDSIGVIRASSADKRERHYGISHHSLTCYSKATFLSHSLGVIEDHELSAKMISQLEDNNIFALHDVHRLSSVGIVDMMEKFNIHVSSMGRKAKDDELFYEMAATSAQILIHDLGSEYV
ncbi:MAG: DUF3866 family protein [Acidimicrobiia bacterium]